MLLGFASLKGFVAWAEFFAKIFGNRQEKLTLKLSEINKFIEEERKKSKALSREVPAIFAEIKHSIKEIKALLAEVERLPIESANERFRKAVETSRGQAVKRLQALLQKLEPPFDASAEQIADYCYASILALQAEIAASRKSIAYTSAMLRDLMLAIGKEFESIANSLEKLRLTINANPIVFSSELEKLLREIEKEDAFLKSVEKHADELREKLASTAKEKERLQEELKALENSEEAKELSKLMERLKELEKKASELNEKLFAEFAPMKKALSKLIKANERGTYFVPERELESAKAILSGSLHMLKKDPKGERIKALINELESAIKEQAIKLKERDLSKVVEYCKILKEKDFFSEFFWPMNEIEAEKQRINKELSKNKVAEKIQNVSQEVKRLERKINELKESLASAEQKKGLAEKRRKELIAKLEALLSKILKKRVEIKER